jgi:ABC-2 type transport system ATP-binding protein
VIELRGLTKRYCGVPAVEDLTVTVRPGLVTGLLGPNEAGKTTTLRMILGLTEPTRGTATTLGCRYSDLPSPIRQVGALLDADAMPGGRRAYDQFLWLARSNGIPRRRVDEVFRLTGLAEVAGRRVRALSPGMRRRLGIAMTLLGDPAVLVYDEPLAGLDPAGIAWSAGLMRRLARQGRTVLVASHLVSEMAEIADHLLIIVGGRLRADAGIEELAGDHARRVLVHCDAPSLLAGRLAGAGARVQRGTGGALMVFGMDPPEIHRTTVACGVRLYELTPQRPSLDQVFLELTRDGAGCGAGPAAACGGVGAGGSVLGCGPLGDAS